MTFLRVELDSLVGEANRLDDVADRMESRIAVARDRMDGLLGAGWSGVSADAFGREFAEWAGAADDTVAVLRDQVVQLRLAARDYAGTEDDARQTVASEHTVLGSLSTLMGGG